MSEQNKYTNKIKNILMNFWDPIGIIGIDGADDEYDLYINEIKKKLESGIKEKDITKFLSLIEKERMGLSPNYKKNQYVALKLIQLKNTD